MNFALALLASIFLAIPDFNAANIDPPIRARLTQLHSAAEKNPTNAEAVGKLGEAFQALEMPSEAESCYREAVRLDPRSARWRYLLGLTQLNAEPESALTNLAAAIPLAGASNDFIRLAYGKALAERGYSTQAAQQFEQILSIPPARVELARIKLSAGDTATVAELLAPCLTNQFAARPARLLLAQAKLKLGDAATAAKLSESAASLPKPFDWPDPFLREVRTILPIKANLLEQATALLAHDRTTEAETLLNSLSNDPDALLLLGRLRAQQKRFAEAEDLFKKHLATNTNSVQGWMQLGIMHFRAEHWPAAAEAFERAAQIKPDYTEAHANLALAYSRQNKSARAIGEFQTALRADPANFSALVNLADEYLRAGQPKEAAATATVALAINPNDPRALRIKQLAH